MSAERPISWSLSSRLRSRAVRPSHPHQEEHARRGPQGRRAFPDRRKTTSILVVAARGTLASGARRSNFVALVLQDTSCFPMPRIRRPPSTPSNDTTGNPSCRQVQIAGIGPKGLACRLAVPSFTPADTRTPRNGFWVGFFALLFQSAGH